VAVRLAQDLYSIISVTEGEDHSILKGMISSGRKGKKTSVVSGCRRRLRSRTQSTAAINQETCACSKELLLLKDTISTLQTNVLNMKQTMCVSDKLRCEQSAVTKSATFALKQSVITCSSSIAEFTGNTLAVIRSISNSLMQQLMAMEDRVRYLEAVIETQQIQGPIYSAHPVSSTIPEMDVTGVPEEVSTADTCVTVDNVVLVQDANDVISNTQNFRSCALPEVDHVEKAAPIPVRVTTRTDTHLEPDGANEWNDIPSRRRTKRFCVLGYNRCVDTDVLCQVISRKGPNVSNIRVFTCRRDPTKAVLRINLMADSDAMRVMEEGFWPPYVTCRPWVDQRAGRENGVHPYTVTDRSWFDRGSVMMRAASRRQTTTSGWRRGREIPPRFRGQANGRERSSMSVYDISTQNRYSSFVFDVD